MVSSLVWARGAIRFMKSGNRKRARSSLITASVVAIVVCVALLTETSPEPPPTQKITTDDLPATYEQTASDSVNRKQLVEDPNAPRIYLTFDDGPSAQSTPKILEILDTYHIKATFFIPGYTAENLPDMVKLIASKGHVIANHSYSHDYRAVYASADVFMKDIEKGEAVLTRILGKAPLRLVRFPAGSAAVELEANPKMREKIKSRLEAGGWRFFDWSVSMGDSISGWTPKPGDLGGKLISAIDERVAVGATDIFVLAHDTDSRPWTPTDLPMVIEHCHEKGYVFRTISLDSPPCEYR